MSPGTDVVIVSRKAPERDRARLRAFAQARGVPFIDRETTNAAEFKAVIVAIAVDPVTVIVGGERYTEIEALEALLAAELPSVQ
jgi:hypothetical protein